MLVNYMENVVNYALLELKSSYPFVCMCDQCKDDMKAIALNSITPHYVASATGEMYTRINELTQQYSTDAMLALARAIEIVHNSRRHPDDAVILSKDTSVHSYALKGEDE